jgi:hypothetical protein
LKKVKNKYNRFNVVDKNENAHCQILELADDNRPIKPRINCQFEDLLDKNGNQILSAGIYIEMFNIHTNKSIPGTQDQIHDFFGQTPKIKEL